MNEPRLRSLHIGQVVVDDPRWSPAAAARLQRLLQAELTARLNPDLAPDTDPNASDAERNWAAQWAEQTLRRVDDALRSER